VADLVAALTDAARRRPDRTAWTFDPGGSLTVAQVADRSAGYAQALRSRGVRAGDRVAVLLRNQPEFPLLWFALARLGATMVPVSPKYRSADAGHLLRTSGAVAVVSTAEFRPLLAGIGVPVVHDLAALASEPGFAQGPVDPAAPVNLQYTSGTSGKPKGCLLSHTYWLTLARSLVSHFPHLTGDDVMLTAQPFHYIDPQWNVVAALLSGAELVVLDGFHPSTFWAKVREHRVSYFYCLGAMPALLLRMPADPADRDHRVRAVQSSAIPPALHAELEARWGVGWYEAFGMTETGADLRVTAADHDALVGTGCLGRPAPHREARVVDGELQLRGPGMMDGYDGRPSPFTPDGWFPTGDLARIDADGRVYHLGRRKDVIRRSGENIAAREVEDVLSSHPRVRLAAVLGVPDEIRGEEVKAFVVADGVTAAELAAFCAERLAAFKVPAFWEFRDDLPRTPSERVAKELLR
jgi:carnitine-CoA ligase